MTLRSRFFMLDWWGKRHCRLKFTWPWRRPISLAWGPALHPHRSLVR